MTRIRTHLGLRRSLGVVTTAGLMLGLGTVGCSAEDRVGGLFERLFSPEPPAQAVQPTQAPMQTASPQQARTSTLQQYYGRRYAYRAETPRAETTWRRPSIRYASLPKPKAEPIKIRISDRQSERQLPLNMSGGAAAAFLKDKTLRPGDIVVLEGGARVFTGHPDKPHSVKDFESIGRSAFVDRHTRTLLSAMVVPVGAMTEAEAKKRMIAMKGLPSLAATPAPLQTAGIRVIYPGGTAP